MKHTEITIYHTVLVALLLRQKVKIEGKDESFNLVLDDTINVDDAIVEYQKLKNQWSIKPAN